MRGYIHIYIHIIYIYISIFRVFEGFVTVGSRRAWGLALLFFGGGVLGYLGLLFLPLTLNPKP